MSAGGYSTKIETHTKDSTMIVLSPAAIVAQWMWTCLDRVAAWTGWLRGGQSSGETLGCRIDPAYTQIKMIRYGRATAVRIADSTKL